MTGDRTTTDPKADKAQPAGASRADPSTEELSRQLAERLARQRAADPRAAAAARRAALLAYDQARERRLVDGNPGRMTEGAVRRYQQDRGQPQTGEIDKALLQQLRQDPAPPAVQQVAQRAARPARSPGPRRSDPFEPVRAAGNRFGQWMDSLVR